MEHTNLHTEIAKKIGMVGTDKSTVVLYIFVNCNVLFLTSKLSKVHKINKRYLKWKWQKYPLL